ARGDAGAPTRGSRLHAVGMPEKALPLALCRKPARPSGGCSVLRGDGADELCRGWRCISADAPHVERHLKRDRKSRIALAISSQCVSRAKWPVSKKRTSAPGMSRLNASAPGGRKNGSFLPQVARNGGLCLRK